MIEIRGDKKVLITPISEEDLADIKIGDIVWLDGELMTCRDVAHRRLVEYGRELPYDIKDKAIFHAGPIVRKIEGTEDDYEMVSVGPTTSMRMEKFEYEFTKLTGVRVIVGKGGMGPNTERACKEFGAIHCVFPAGCAVVAATEVEKIVEHHWDDDDAEEKCHDDIFGTSGECQDDEGEKYRGDDEDSHPGKKSFHIKILSCEFLCQ